MSFYAISALINAVASLILAVFVILKKRKDPVHITFFIFSSLVFLWSTGYFFWQFATTAEDALFLVRLFMAASIFISTSFLHFVLVFIGEASRYKKQIILSYIIFAAFLISDTTSLFVADVAPRLSFPFWPVPGILFHPFFLLWTAQVVYVLVVLYKKYRQTTGSEHNQTLLILVGTALGFLGGSTNHLLWYGIPVLPVGNILVASYVFAVAVAILKYQLFNIKLILVESAILLLNLFLIINIFTSHTTFDYVLNISGAIIVFVFSIYLLRGIYSEIRDRERIEELVWQKAQANDRLRQMEIQKTEFVSIASHQLRTPLTIIKGYASMILEGTFGVIGPKAEEAMTKLYNSSVKLVTLVEDLLTVSRIEQGRTVINFEKIDFKKFVQEAIAEMEKEARDAKIYLSFSMEEGTNADVYIDVKKFKQAVKRIIENAIKYTVGPDFVYITISFDRVAKKVRLVISDSGLGMTSEQISNIFKRFKLDPASIEENVDFRETDSPFESRGQGIGLYIAQGIIEAHHGALLIESSGPRAGTTVVVELPPASTHESMVN